MLKIISMKKILFFLFISFSTFSFAQSIQGVVLDEIGEGLPFATLQLFKADSSVQKVETTRADGTFRFTNLTENNYRLEISFIGFKLKPKLIDLLIDRVV